MSTIKCGETIGKTTTIKCVSCGSTKNMHAGETVPPCSKCDGCTFYYD